MAVTCCMHGGGTVRGSNVLQSTKHRFLLTSYQPERHAACLLQTSCGPSLRAAVATAACRPHLCKLAFNESQDGWLPYLRIWPNRLQHKAAAVSTICSSSEQAGSPKNVAWATGATLPKGQGRTCSAKRYSTMSPSGPACLSCWMYLHHNVNEHTCTSPLQPPRKTASPTTTCA